MSKEHVEQTYNVTRPTMAVVGIVAVVVIGRMIWKYDLRDIPQHIVGDVTFSDIAPSSDKQYADIYTDMEIAQKKQHDDKEVDGDSAQKDIHQQDINQKVQSENPAPQQDLINNKKKEEKSMTQDIITTESGLQYQVITMGEGPMPTLDDTVEVHYHGTLEDGTVFDSSVERGEKISFPLNSVIAGWQEGLQLMPVGSKFKFIIPPELGYGSQAIGKIPANSTLIFEVELFAIK